MVIIASYLHKRNCVSIAVMENIKLEVWICTEIEALKGVLLYILRNDSRIAFALTRFWNFTITIPPFPNTSKTFCVEIQQIASLCDNLFPYFLCHSYILITFVENCYYSLVSALFMEHELRNTVVSYLCIFQSRIHVANGCDSTKLCKDACWQHLL